MTKMTDDEWKIINFIEEHYLIYSEFPPLAKIVERTDIPQIDIVKHLQNPKIRKSIDARGITWNPVDDDRLTERQLACIEAMLNIYDTRPVSQKLKTLGIYASTYYGWKKKPYFMEAYRKASRELYGQTIPELHQTVLKRALDGDPKMLQTALAISGEWDDKKSVEAMNIQFVLAKVLEVIQRNVQDKDALIAISQEFDQLVSPTKKAIGS